MAESPTAHPRFAFSRRDPDAILKLARQRQRSQGSVRVLALGGQARDRVYLAQLLANTLGVAFAQFDLDLRGVAVEDEKLSLERLIGFARSTPAVLFIDGAETIFEQRGAAPGERATALGGYLRRVLKELPGFVVFGMPEQVTADYSRLPNMDLEVTFRAPSGQVISGKPVLLPSYQVDESLLPAHNFRVDIDDVEVGLCEVSAPQLIAGPYSEHDFNPRDGVQAFAALNREDRALWPTITLRRAVSQSRLFFDWKTAQQGGKPLTRVVTIRQLDWSTERVVNTWVVDGCWARRWAGPDFNAAIGAVAEEEIELYYREIFWR